MDDISLRDDETAAAKAAGHDRRTPTKVSHVPSLVRSIVNDVLAQHQDQQALCSNRPGRARRPGEDCSIRSRRGRMSDSISRYRELWVS
jgi:hypothetical protein